MNAIDEGWEDLTVSSLEKLSPSMNVFVAELDCEWLLTWDIEEEEDLVFTKMSITFAEENNSIMISDRKVICLTKER